MFAVTGTYWSGDDDQYLTHVNRGAISVVRFHIHPYDPSLDVTLTAGDDYVIRRLGHLGASVEAGKLRRQLRWARIEIRRHRTWRPAPCSRLWRDAAVFVRLRADALLDIHRWRWWPDLHHTGGDRVALADHYGLMFEMNLRHWAQACGRRYLLP